MGFWGFTGSISGYIRGPLLRAHGKRPLRRSKKLDPYGFGAYRGLAQDHALPTGPLNSKPEALNPNITLDRGRLPLRVFSFTVLFPRMPSSTLIPFFGGV